MDTTNRRPHLPALSYLDVDQVKREEESHQTHSTLATPQHSAPVASPTYHHYPGGPAPPTYTHSTPQHANTWPGMNSSVHTPPASRRTSGDEQEGTKQPARHSLPSISEALGPGPLDSHTQFTPVNVTSQPPPPPPSSHLPPPPQSAVPRSPQPSARRSYPMEPPPSQSHAHFSYFRQDSAGPIHTYTSPDVAKPPYGPLADGRQPLNGHAEHPPPRSQPAAPYSATQTTSPSYDRPQAEAGSSMPPPSSTFAYGYQSHPPRYPPASTNGNPGPIYQPSTQYPAPTTPATPSWKAENGPSRYLDERSPAAPYGESVKRHLEAYDIEEALNEIRSTSNILSDFSRRYGDRMHADARTGVSPSTLPSLVEMDEMIHKAGTQMDYLSKIREMIHAQHAAYEQQIADQRHKAFAEPTLPPPTDHLHVSEEMKGGFANGETKKRRGRAAAPGRCHSCQRSETPEWRRGPDGARTLCNACGLHFAKMARKQQNSANGAVQSSNLRPKEG